MLDLDQQDPEHMLDRIRELPQQCAQAWEAVQGVVLPEGYDHPDGVVVLGMGGSAIGGDLASALARPESPAPCVVCRDYTLPAWVGPRTVVIASSYSGNTEETLTAFEQAVDRGARLVVLTTGGTLLARALELGLPRLTFSYQAQPRATLGYSFIYLVGLFQKLGLLADKQHDMTEAQRVLEHLQPTVDITVPLTENPARQLAAFWRDHFVVVYGAEHLGPVARRWRGQVAENSKTWAAYEELPELDHNAVVGYEHPATLRDNVAVVLLNSTLYHPRIQVRVRATAELLARRQVTHQILQVQGESPLAQMLWAIHYGDFASYYLALLYGADPTPVEAIVYLKERLAQAKV
ncbi:MAG: bifunctional phosphoglucose/phosphomannose isomerase [Chloroflexi bacterium]|nr:bifunctional phosphoglucose/phosphomannose isomerase [Chloroflexota bacterium]